MRPILICFAILGSSCAFAAENCQVLFQQHLKTDLTLSYQAFDQTEGSGFRVLAQEGCDKEAADLIESYIEATGSTKSSLRWHVAQLRASAGESQDAIRYAESTLVAKEDFSVNPLRWNDYVLATIAFLKHDRDTLIYHRDKVAAASGAYFGNALNLKLLDSLVKYFDRDYKFATSNIED